MWCLLLPYLISRPLCAQVKSSLAGAGAEAQLAAEMDEIRAELSAAFPVLRAAFTYYALSGAELAGGVG